MKNQRKVKPMSNLAGWKTYQKYAVAYRQTNIKDDKESTIDTLLNNSYFLEEVARVRDDFTKNFTDTKKYPKLNKNIWK